MDLGLAVVVLEADAEVLALADVQHGAALPTEHFSPEALSHSLVH